MFLPWQYPEVIKLCRIGVVSGEGLVGRNVRMLGIASRPDVSIGCDRGEGITLWVVSKAQKLGASKANNRLGRSHIVRHSIDS